MSDYFTRKNTKEFGSEHTGVITFLVVEDPLVTGQRGVTRLCYVKAKTGFEARDEARKIIPDFIDSAFLCYPNPMTYGIKLGKDFK